jgi:hypothetical protein
MQALCRRREVLPHPLQQLGTGLEVAHCRTRFVRRLPQLSEPAEQPASRRGVIDVGQRLLKEYDRLPVGTGLESLFGGLQADGHGLRPSLGCNKMPAKLD